MPLDLSPHIDPATTAVIGLEVQENLLLPESAMIPGLAGHASSIGLIDRLEGLYAEARRVGSQMIYVTDERRSDGLGGPRNTMVGRAITGPSGTEGRRSPGHGPIVSRLTPQPRDIWIKR
jgi:hypothetical protein